MRHFGDYAVTDFDKAYYAGILDSEGSIVIARYKKESYVAGYRLGVMVTLSNNCKSILEEIQRRYGGSIVWHQSISGRDNWQSCFTGKVAERFLKDVIQYMRIKKPQAELALKLQGLLHDGHSDRRGNKIPAEEWAKREEIRLQIKALNSRYNGRNDPR